MEKKLWVSALAKDSEHISRITSALRNYGFNCQGHIWVDDAQKLAWRVAYDELVHEKSAYWVLLADDQSLATASVRYALSLMAYAMLRDQAGNMPIIILAERSESRDLLPPILRQAQFIVTGQAGWEARFVAATIKMSRYVLPYRIDAYGDEHIGQWFEIGPIGQTWSGLAFGVAGEGAAIDFQGVGPAGQLPEKSLLLFPMQGIKISVGDSEFIAWSVNNSLDSDQSYFVRVRGLPDKFLLLPDFEHEATTDAEAFIVPLT